MTSQDNLPSRPPRNGRVLCATIDISARFASVSPSWLAVLGWDAPALLGDTFVVRVHPDDMEDVIGAMHSALSSGATTCFAARYAHRDGIYLTVRWRLAPRLDRLRIDLIGRPRPRIPPESSR